jgi:hypothetical protein
MAAGGIGLHGSRLPLRPLGANVLVAPAARRHSLARWKRSLPGRGLPPGSLFEGDTTGPVASEGLAECAGLRERHVRE